MLLALIDADIVAYQAASSAEQPVKWDDDLWTLHAYESDGERIFRELIETIRKKSQAQDVILAFSDSHNFRKDILPSYKENRSGTRKPMLLKCLKEYGKRQYESYQMDNLEGDDVLGILSTDPEFKMGHDLVVCSLDKDFKTVPGYHYNFGKDQEFSINTQESHYWHMYQTLTGDATDGYSGCPGIGPKKAEKILNEGWRLTDWGISYWDAVVKTYEKAGLCEEEALVQARVSYILKKQDYDYETGEVKLWTPRNSK